MEGTREIPWNGIIPALLAFLSWGFAPLYWKHLAHVSSSVILAHRILWSFALLGIFIALKGQMSEIFSGFRSKRTFLIFCLSTVLIAANWYLFIWAVNSGQVLQASLGYYINPMVNVLLGVFVLRERLSRGQLIATVLASLGVLILAFHHGHFPWIALSLAMTFGWYGLLRKIAPLGSLEGLCFETLLLTLPAAIFLQFAPASSNGSIDAATLALLAGGGIVTSVPLLWFASAARNLPLSQIGFFQFISPSCQFLLAVLVYHEAFTISHLLTFGLIWSSLIVYCVDLSRLTSSSRRA
jgi:chloramphenicol-sensitive protein RarD